MIHHHSWQETFLGQGPPKMKVTNHWHEPDTTKLWWRIHVLKRRGTSEAVYKYGIPL